MPGKDPIAPQADTQQADNTPAWDLLHQITSQSGGSTGLSGPTLQSATPSVYTPSLSDYAKPVTAPKAPGNTAPSQAQQLAEAALHQRAIVNKQKQEKAATEYAAQMAVVKQVTAAADDALDQQAWQDVRAKFPTLSQDDLSDFQKSRKAALAQQATDAQNERFNIPDAHFTALVGGNEGRLKGLVGPRNKGMAQTMEDNLSDGSNLAKIAASGPVLTAIGAGSQAAFTAKNAFDESFARNPDGSWNPEFKKQVMILAGGDPNKFADAAQAIYEGKVSEYDNAPNTAASMVNSALDFLHERYRYVNPLAYYGASAAISGVQSALKTGAYLNKLLVNDPKQYNTVVTALNQFSDKSQFEGKNGNKVLDFLDELGGQASRMYGQIETLGAVGLGGSTSLVSDAVEQGALKAQMKAAVMGDGSILANTAGNKAFAGMSNVLNGLSASKLPVYLDNVVTTTRMFYPSMYHDYYTEALQKGYTPQEAEEVAGKRALVATSLMSIGNWVGPTQKSVTDGLVKTAMSTEDRQAAQTLIGKLGYFGRQAVAKARPKDAAIGALGMGISNFGDAYQDHQESIARGEIPADTPFNPVDAFTHAAESAMVGFLAMGTTHLVGNHGNLTETPQATALYQAATNPQLFYQAVDKQVSRGQLTPDKATALKGLVSRIGEGALISPTRDGVEAVRGPSLLQQAFSTKTADGKTITDPAMAVKLAVEQARQQDATQAIAELTPQLNVVKHVNADGAVREEVLAKDANGNYTTEAGKAISDQIADLKDKAKASETASKQLLEGSYLRGRTVTGDEMLQLSGKFSPDNGVTPEQAKRIIGEGPYEPATKDLNEYIKDPEVARYLLMLGNNSHVLSYYDARNELLHQRADLEQPHLEHKDASGEVVQKASAIPEETQAAIADIDTQLRKLSARYPAFENETKGQIPLEKAKEIIGFTPQNQNAPIIGEDGNIIDGRKRIAYMIHNGQTEAEVMQPKSVVAAAESAQQSRDIHVGSDAPITDHLPEKERDAAELAHDAYQSALEQPLSEADHAAGLTPAFVGLRDAVKELTSEGIDKQDGVPILQAATGNVHSPADIDAAWGVATGTRSIEKTAPVDAETRQANELSRMYGGDDEVTKSPLWDSSTNRPKPGVTEEDIAAYQVTGELPEPLKDISSPKQPSTDEKANEAERRQEGLLAPDAEQGAVSQEGSAPVSAVVEQLKLFTDEPTITAFADRTADQVEQSEPIAEGIERKAESDNEVELNEAIEAADKFINDGAASTAASADEQSGRRAGEQASVINRDGPTILASKESIDKAGWDGKGRNSIDKLATNLQRLFGEDAHGQKTGLVVFDNASKKDIPGIVGEPVRSDAFYHPGTNAIYLNVDRIRPEQTLHEIGHVWLGWAQHAAPELYARGMGLAKETGDFKFMSALLDGKRVSASDFDISEDAAKRWRRYVKEYKGRDNAADLLADEVLQHTIEQEGRNIAGPERKGIMKWLDDLWNGLKNAAGFKGVTTRQLSAMSLDDFSRRVAKEVTGSGKLTTTVSEPKVEPAPEISSKFSLSGDDAEDRQALSDAVKKAADDADAQGSDFVKSVRDIATNAFLSGMLDKDAAVKLYMDAVRTRTAPETRDAFVKNVEKDFGGADEKTPTPELGNVINPTPQDPGAPVVSSAFTTSIMKADRDKELYARGMEAMPEVERRGLKDVWDGAGAALDRDPNAIEGLLASLRESNKGFGKKRSLTDDEVGLLLRKKVSIQNDLHRADAAIVEANGNEEDMKVAVQRREQIENILTAFNHDVARAVTETARGLKALQMMSNDRYDLSTLINAKAAANDGVVTGEIVEQAKKTRKKIVDAEQAIVKHQDEKTKSESQESAKAAVEKETRKPRPALTAKPGERSPKYKTLKSRFADIIARSKGSALHSLPEKADNPIPDDAKDIVKEMVRDLIRESVPKKEWTMEDVDTIMNTVAKDLSEHLPEVTARDVADTYSGYGQTTEPKDDPLSQAQGQVRRLSQLKSSIENIETYGVPPERTGYQRGDKSESVRESEAKLHQLLKEHNLQTTDPMKQLKSAEDAAARALNNEIDALGKEILSGKWRDRATGEPLDTPKLAALRAKRDLKRSERDAILGKRPVSEEQRIKTIIKALEAANERKERQIASGNVEVAAKEVLSSDAIEALRAKGDKLNKEISDLRKKVNEPKEVEIATKRSIEAKKRILDGIVQKLSEHDIAFNKKKSLVDQNNKELKDITEALDKARAALKEARDEAGLTLQQKKERYAKDIQERINQIQTRIAAGDFKPAERPKPRELDHEEIKLKATLQKAKDEWDEGVHRDRMANRNKFEKLLDDGAQLTRNFKLSGIFVLGKLSSAAIENTVLQVPKSAVGHLLSKLPGLNKAYGEGRANISKEVKNIVKGFMKGVKELPEITKNGESELDRLYGKHRLGGDYSFGEGNVAKVLNTTKYVGHLHQALKNPLKRAVFESQYAKRLDNKYRASVDVTDELIQMQTQNEAYQDALRAIYMNDNKISTLINNAIRGLEAKGESGHASVAGKATATILKTLMPFTRVPTNIINSVLINTGGGAFTGTAMYVHAMAKGMEKLTPTEADHITRLMKNGYLGLAMSYTGWALAKYFGGFYQKGKNEDQDKPQEGEIQIFGTNFPKWLFHSDQLEAMQFGANARKIFDDRVDTDGSAETFRQAYFKSFFSVASQVPLFQVAGEVHDAVKATQSQHGNWLDGLGKFGQQYMVGNTIPLAIQDIAKIGDMDEHGRTQRRYAKGPLENYEKALPRLRNTLPTSYSK